MFKVRYKTNYDIVTVYAVKDNEFLIYKEYDNKLMNDWEWVKMSKFIPLEG